MDKPIEIKRATVYDIPLIFQFIKELAEYEQLLHEVVADEELLQETLFGSQAHAEVIFAFFNGQPVGFALFFHNFSTFLGRSGIYLEDLYVRPAARGQGIGKALFAYLAQLAKDRNCGRLEWRVLDWNETAINFYKSLEAQPMDEWTVYRIAGEALNNLANNNTRREE